MEQSTDKAVQQSTVEDQPKVEAKTEAVDNTKWEAEWNDGEASKLLERFKNDPKEIAKAKWFADKHVTQSRQELAKLQKELETYRKSATPASADAKADGKAEPKAEKVEANSLGEIQEKLYLEVFQNGKPSDETVAELKKLGYTDSLIKEEIAAKSQIIQARKKVAQKYADTPIDTLIKFAEEEGNFSDKELAVLQMAMNVASETDNPEWYRFISIIDKAYQSKGKATVQHGSISGTLPEGDGYQSPDDYYKDKKDPRYGFDREYTTMVDSKAKRSNRDNWAQAQLEKFVGRR